MLQSTAEQPSIDFGVGGMTCGSCAARVQRVLSRQPDVEQAEVNFETGRAHVVLREPGADIEALRTAVAKIGYELRDVARQTVVSALDPQVMVTVPEREDLRPIADEAGHRIRAALDALKG